MNICFVSQEYPEETGWGGIGTYTREMAHGLAKIGHTVCVISRALKKRQVYREADGVTIYRILPRFNISRIPMLWRSNRVWEGYHLAIALQLQKTIREQYINIVEAPALHGETTFFQFLRRKIPVVVRIHSCMPKAMELNNVPWHLPLWKSHWCERQAVSLAHGLTAPSQAIVRDNLPHLPMRCRVHVIGNPIDTDMFHPPAANQGRANDKNILFVGRIDQRKGVHILGQAIPSVWNHNPEVLFTFVGKDGRSPDGESMIKWISMRVPADKRNQLNFIDHLPRQDVISLYQKALLVILPSVWEPFGYICTEAMACGKPLVATRSGGPEEIIVDGRTGFLIPPNDPFSLAEKIIESLSDETRLRSIGREARESILKQYRTDVIVKKMVDYYRSVIERSKSE